MPKTAPFKKAKTIDEDVLCVLRRMVWTEDDRCVIPDRCEIYPKVKKVLEALQRGERPTPGPQNGRKNAMPLGGKTTLTELGD